MTAVTATLVSALIFRLPRSLADAAEQEVHDADMPRGGSSISDVVEDLGALASVQPPFVIDPIVERLKAFPLEVRLTYVCNRICVYPRASLIAVV